MAWIIQNNELVNTNAVNIPGKPFVGDSPYTFWRVDENANDGMPYVGLMTGVPVLAPEPPVAVTDIYFRSSAVSSMYFGSREVTAAFFGERKVF